MKNESAKQIEHYVPDGFVRVCDVEEYYSQWQYKNINQEVMYDDHRSWIYFIVAGTEIVKIGETGQPLGIKMSDGQPKKGTECRLGRIRSGDGTDFDIRHSLREDLESGTKVSIWALKCPSYLTEHKIAGNAKQINTTIHKALELHYIDYFENQTGHKPILNKGRK
jgi:hypothetical protein